MAKQLTIRGVSRELAVRLRRMGVARGQSVNGLVLEILGAAAGIDERRLRLERYATASPDDAAKLDHAIALQRTIDDVMWR